MVGSGVAEYTMVYHPAAPGVTDPHAMTASYTGLMYFKGSIDGSDEGEAVFLCSGSYEGEAKASWHLDEKTTTGGLAGLKRLSGGYVSKGMKGAPAWLDLAPSTRS